MRKLVLAVAIAAGLAGGLLYVAASGRSAAPAFAQACVPPPSGMVSWWPGDGNANDIQDGNNGTLVNGATFAAGKVGQAFSFDGIDDQVSVGVPNFETPNTGFSIDAWIAPDTIAPLSQFQTIVHRETNYSSSRTWWLGVDGAGIRFVLFLTATAPNENRVDVIAPSVVRTGVFQHVVAVYDGSTASLYYDGVLVKSQVVGSANFNTGDPINLGREDLGVGVTFNPFDGLIDEVEIYNRALSATEIAAIFNAGSAGKCKASPPTQCELNLAAAQQQIQSLQSQLAAANTTIQTLQGLNSTLTAANQTLTLANQALTTANAALQTQVNTLTADNAALQTQVTTLMAEKDALQTQVTTLMAEKAALTSGLSSGSDGIEQTLQMLFNDPQFQIQGATLLEQYQNLVNALNGLNKGRLEGLYKALGGKK